MGRGEVYGERSLGWAICSEKRGKADKIGEVQGRRASLAEGVFAFLEKEDLHSGLFYDTKKTTSYEKRY
jgi:hypothetical protein